MKDDAGVEQKVDENFLEFVMPKVQIKDYENVKDFLRKQVGKTAVLPNKDNALIQSIYEREDNVVIVYNKIGGDIQ